MQASTKSYPAHTKITTQINVSIWFIHPFGDGFDQMLKGQHSIQMMQTISKQTVTSKKSYFYSAWSFFLSGYILWNVQRDNTTSQCLQSSANHFKPIWPPRTSHVSLILLDCFPFRESKTSKREQTKTNNRIKTYSTQPPNHHTNQKLSMPISIIKQINPRTA